MTIRFSDEASQDLDTLIDYVALRNPRAARRFTRRIFETIDLLAEGHLDGPENTLTSGERVRSWPVRPVRIYYVREGDALTILRIYHQAQRPFVR